MVLLVLLTSTHHGRSMVEPGVHAAHGLGWGKGGLCMLLLLVRLVHHHGVVGVVLGLRRRSLNHLGHYVMLLLMH